MCLNLQASTTFHFVITWLLSGKKQEKATSVAGSGGDSDSDGSGPGPSLSKRRKPSLTGTLVCIALHFPRLAFKVVIGCPL